jgi:hypothetical protein
VEQNNGLQQVESHKQGSFITCIMSVGVMTLETGFQWVLLLLKVTLSDAKKMTCKLTGNVKN